MLLSLRGVSSSLEVYISFGNPPVHDGGALGEVPRKDESRAGRRPRKVGEAWPRPGHLYSFHLLPAPDSGFPGPGCLRPGLPPGQEPDPSEPQFPHLKNLLLPLP